MWVKRVRRNSVRTVSMGTEASAARCLSEDALLAYLGRGEDPSFDTDAVQPHLDECDRCRRVLAAAARSLGAGSAGSLTAEDLQRQQQARGPADARTLEPGDVVMSRYEVRRFVARGGMGEVYEAHDRLLGERVALKTLTCTALDDHRAAFRFKAEARLARRVTHPNVCRILEFGLHVRSRPRAAAESIPFLTMEFLEGETLHQRILRDGPLREQALVPMLLQVLGALESIHDAGVVHRDLKSENVFLVPDGRGGERVVVMDFGLARAMDGSVISSWPAVGTLVGTIDCMAPEQIQGQPVGVTTDVYATGVLLFEMLTGQRPFVNTPPLKRLHQVAPAPSSVRPEVQRRWDDIVARCLRVQPEGRYPTVAALRAALTARGGRARWWLIAGATALVTAGLLALTIG